MVAWYWLIVVGIIASFLSGSFILGVFLYARMVTQRRTPHIKFDVTIVDDKLAEKTSVEFADKQFAFPVDCGHKIADLLTQFAVEAGGESSYQMPRGNDNNKQVHKLVFRERL